MPTEEFSDLELTEESVETYYRLYRTMPAYRTSPEFREIVDGTFLAERKLIQTGLAPEEERALWAGWEAYGNRLQAWMARSLAEPITSPPEH